MRADTGKSAPVLKEFLVEAMMVPLTPEKPIISGERPIYRNEQALSSQDCIMAEKEEYLSKFTQQIPPGEMPRVSKEEYSSGFADGTSRNEPPNRLCESISSSSSNSIHQESFPACRNSTMGQNPTPQWRSMTFMDLLTLNGGNQLSSGFLSDLDYRSLMSENQEIIGLRGSNQDILRIQENDVHPNGSRSGIIMNAFHDGFMHAFAPATPDLSKRLQNGEGGQLSVVDDLLGIKGRQPPTDSVAMESYDPTKGGDADIDLNKTIEQKPRRKKHRPKVVREVKPKQTPKERKPKPTDANGTPRQKRTYVRKNKANMPTTPPERRTEEPLDGKIPDPGVKSCRKALNFDLEDQVKEKKPTDANETPRRKRKYVPKNKTNISSTPPSESGAEALDCKTPDLFVKSCRKALNFDMEDQVKENNFSHTSTDNPPSEQLAQDLYPREEKAVTMGGTQEYSTYDIFRNNQTLNGYMSMPEREAQSIPHPTMATPSENEFHAATGAMPPRDFFACSPNFRTCASSSEDGHMRSLKRVNSYSADASNVGAENLTGHCTPSQSMGNSSCTHGMNFPETHKKRKSEMVFMPNTSDISSSRNAIEDTRAKTSSKNYPREAAKTPQYYYSLLVPHFNISAEANSLASATTNHQDNTQFVNWVDVDLLKRSKDPTHVGDLDLLKGLEESKKTSRSPAKGRGKGTQKKNAKACNTSCMEALSVVSIAKQEDTRKSRKKTSGEKSVTSSFSMVNKHSLNLYNGQHLTGNSNGPFLALPWIDTNSINVQYQEQGTLIPYHVQTQQLNALVLYQRDGVIVPFEGTLSSKRRPRAKVDLDDETNRVWSLLLEDINNQGIDGTDEEKKKWWEEERNVFRGRVDSFIARMRLVQGDRRFSPWKGSVVDSVVGVFLTQNVSDHLSSSAFMSVAARYPLKSTNKVRRDSEEEIGSSVKEPEICIVELDDNSDTVALNEKAVEGPVCDRNSKTLLDIDVRKEKVGDSKESHDYTNLTDDTWCLSHSSQGKESHDYTNLTDDTWCPSHSSQGEPHESQLYTSSIKESGIPSPPMVDRAIDDVAIDDVTSSQLSVISSQNSVESSGVPTLRKMGPSSDSSSEGEGPTHRSNPSYVHSESFVELLKMAETPMRPSYQSDLPKPSEKPFTTELMSNFLVVQNKCSAICQLHSVEEYLLQAVDEESRSVNSTSFVENLTTEPSKATAESATEFHLHKKPSISNMGPSFPFDNVCSRYVLEGEEMVFQSLRQPVREQEDAINPLTEKPIPRQMNIKLPSVSRDNVTPESTCASNSTIYNELIPTPPLSDHNHSLGEAHNMFKQDAVKQKTGKDPRKTPYDWDSLRRQAQSNGSTTRQRTTSTMDSVDWEAVRCADVGDIAETIKERGMNNRLAERIQEFLNRIVNDHSNIDLEWLRDVPPDKAKEYLLSIRGLGLKSVECVRLLTLHHLAFPVDTNVGRIAVRLGWVPLQPLPESLQLHLLEMYPVLESIQKYLWPRLCKLDQRTLYELHYHMITFGKVFCTKRQPNCNACPLRGECRHFASAFASARLALPGPQDKSIVLSNQSNLTHQDPQVTFNSLPLSLPLTDQILETKSDATNCEPIVEIPASPEPEPEPEQIQECDIEDAFSEDPNEIPTIKLDMEEFTQTLQAYMQSNKDLQEGDMSKALVALAAEAASIPTPKLKSVSRLRTEHHVYELPDTHQLIRGLDKREPDDPSPYLLAIWSPGETANSIEPPQKRCDFQEPGELCSDETCCYCNSQREANTQIVRGTLLIPCRTAMRGSFPLNGTYFQVNEVFADHDSSLNPIQVPRTLLWNLPRRTVYFGTTIPTIFKGLSTEGIQHCFWRGYVCVRGFDQNTRAPRPLMARLHISAFKMAKARGKS